MSHCLGERDKSVPPTRQFLVHPPAHEPTGATLEPTKAKVLLALEPRVLMAAMQTTMIRASITAYSTAVGPSSLLRKLTRCCVNLRMCLIPLLVNRWKVNRLLSGKRASGPAHEPTGAT